MEVEWKEVEVVGSPEHGARFQIIPVETRIPEDVATSKEVAQFFRKRHKKVGKMERPTRVGEVG